MPQKAATSKEFTDFFRTLLPVLTDEDLELLNAVYPDPVTNSSSKHKETRKGLGLGAQFRRLEQAYGQFAYICPVKHTAHFVAQSNTNVYLYHFAAQSNVKGGAIHGGQAPFVTHNKDIRDVSKTADEISGLMHAYWTSFIVSGDPNAVDGRYGDRPEWPSYVAGRRKLVVFGEGNDEVAGGGNKGTAVRVKDDDWAVEECRYWWDRTEKFEV